MKVEKIAIVGLGLMGGSLALALRPHVRYLAVVDTNSKTLDAARSFVDLATNDLANGIREAELVVLATPVRTILDLLPQIPALKPDGCMILDLGSTKREICHAMDELPANFQSIGGHPMCGREVSGFESAFAGLFQNQTFVLCHGKRPHADVEEAALAIVERIGASALFLTPETHDSYVAGTSHLPYLIASLLMNNAASKQEPQMWQVSASGFRDTTRLAGSDPVMMGDIIMTNKESILDELAHYRESLASLIDLVLAGDEQAVVDWLRVVQALHKNYRQHLEQMGAK